VFTYLSPKKELLTYLRIFKAGNNQITGFLNDFFKKQGGQVEDRIKYQAVASKRALANATCAITAIRDPISHFLSGYNEVEFRNKKGPPAAPYTRFVHGSKLRFEQFVADFLGGVVTGENEGRTPVQNLKFQTPEIDEWAHLYSMVGVLTQLALSGGKLVSYLPTISNLTNDFPKFLYNTCPGLPESLLDPKVMEVHGQHESSKDPSGTYNAAKAVWMDGGPMARALCAMHAMDYACWDQLPDGIPNLCKDVFGSQRFIQAVGK
jgi:hypothetical protein